MRSAIILAGGSSSRMKGEKGLRILGGKPIVEWVVGSVSESVDEVILVVGSEAQASVYRELLGDQTRVAVDLYRGRSPVVGALTGLSLARGEYALLVGYDMPFIRRDAVELLFGEAEGAGGATFVWPNGWLEPLLAVYGVDPGREAARRNYEEGDMRLGDVLRRMRDVRMIAVERLKLIDPELLTLFDVDTEERLREAEGLLASGAHPDPDPR
jgi:molybdopterin-guanine dinucleotide biosynthesis protein A